MRVRCTALALAVAFTASCGGGAEPEGAMETETRPTTRSSTSGTAAAPTTAEESGVHLADDFSYPDSGWTVAEDGRRAVGYANGTYRMVLKKALVWTSGLELRDESGEPETAAAIRVEADARRVGGTTKVIFGIGCYQSRDEGILFGITPTGGYAVLAFGSGGKVTPLDLAESGVPVFEQPAKMNRLRADCVGDEGSVRFSFHVNGKRVFSSPPVALAAPRFESIVLFADTGQPPAEVIFDDVSVRPVDD